MRSAIATIRGSSARRSSRSSATRPTSGTASCWRGFSIPTIATASSTRSRAPTRTARRLRLNTGCSLGTAKSTGCAPAQEPDDTVRSVVASGTPQVVPPLGGRSNGQDPGGFLAGIDPSTVICCPLRARGRSLGAITVARTTREQAYGADDLALVEDIAGRIALAVDRARLYAEVEQRGDAARGRA